MSWLQSFVGRFKKPKGLYPECLWNVSADETGFRAIDQTGKTAFASRDGLASVVIATSDSGPWGADVWWLLYDADGQLACGFPQGATGEKGVLDALMALPGFDENKMIEAMGCTSNATFVVWRRKSPLPTPFPDRFAKLSVCQERTDSKRPDIGRWLTMRLPSVSILG